MLTRLKVQGFKNLVDVELCFGPYTCIAGPNGVGKSNIFDAIQFLSSLADKTLLESATKVRQETSSANAGRIFTRGQTKSLQEIRIEADMIVPRTVRDDLEQEAVPSTTSLRYTIAIRLHNGDQSSIPRLELVEEKLDYITKSKMRLGLPYAKGHEEWLASVLHGRRTNPLISTDTTSEGIFIKVHEDSGHQGRGQQRRVDFLPRTVLSTINNAENPTALAARREMQSWRLLHLEPSQLRASDEINAIPIMTSDGRNLAATLNRMMNSPGRDAAALRARIANRLADLIDDVRDVKIERDDKRELLTVFLKGREDIWFRARDLSDGTLRFLALSVLEVDDAWGGLVCMEEPENGIHPSRISAMLKLLEDLAVDTTSPVDETNPLRQVIFNTHSPDVVGLTHEDSLLFAKPCEIVRPEGKFQGVACRPLSGTWRARSGEETISKGEILQFLKSLPLALKELDGADDDVRPVAKRPEFLEQLALPF